MHRIKIRNNKICLQRKQKGRGRTFITTQVGQSMIQRDIHMQRLKKKNLRNAPFVIKVLAICGVILLFDSFKFDLSPLHTTFSKVFNPFDPTSPQEIGPTAIIHIGPYRSGTHLIQRSITSLEKQLKIDGYGITGDGDTGNNLLACYMKAISKILNIDCKTKIRKKAVQLGSQKSNVILSSQVLSNRVVNTGRNMQILDRFLKPWPNKKFIIVYKRFFEYALESHLDKMRQLTSQKRVSFADKYNKMKFDWIDFTKESWTNRTLSIFSEHFGNSSVHVINLHDKKHSLLENLYCNTIKDTRNACRKVKKDKIIKPPKEFPLVYHDLVYAAKEKGIYKPEVDTWAHVKEVAVKVKKRQEKSLGLTEYDFPTKDCLSETRQSKLLSVSLEMEKHFFPDFFATKDGEKAMKDEFAEFQEKGLFCNIDFDQILAKNGTDDDSRWYNFFKELSTGNGNK